MISPKLLSAHAIALAVALLASAATFCAQAAEPATPMVLRSVMDQLGRDMQAVTGAITWLGTDAGKFRGFDGEVHDAAIAMGEAATRGDGQAVIAAFAKLQQGCLACHQTFRKPFTEHFYGTR